MYKRIKIALVVCLMCFGLVAFSYATELELRIGVVLPGSPAELGWCYGGYEAVRRIMEARPDVIKAFSYAEFVCPGAALGVIMDFVGAGYNWIWVWGFQYREAVAAAAAMVDGVYFTINQGRPWDAIPGEVAIIQEFPHEAGFLLGVAAAAMSETGKAACIFGMLIFELDLAGIGFEEGLVWYDPYMKHSRIVVGAWADPAGGLLATDALILMGADMIFSQGNGTSLGIAASIIAHTERGYRVFYIGYPVDQWELAPGLVLTSICYDYLPIFKALVEDIELGRFGERNYVMELGSGIELAPFRELKHQLPPHLLDLLWEVRGKIIAGEIIVPTRDLPVPDRPRGVIVHGPLPYWGWPPLCPVFECPICPYE